MPGVLQVACRALRALRFGDLADDVAAVLLPGTFSLPEPAVETDDMLGAVVELVPPVVVRLSVM